jgi:RND family efflux transporter MFP subunit
VSGTIIAVSPEFEPGGRFKVGEELVQIDPVDYELVVAAREADRAQAQRAYKEELGYQEVARHEWELVDNREAASELEQELTLRKPQLASAEASLKAAEASLRKAQLDLQRTAVTAPFDAVILEQRVDLGSQVSAQTVLADLACTDAYWVEVTLPVDLLQWVERARRETAALPVEVYPSGGTVDGAGWTGTVIRRRADLEPNGRLARIIVAVENPLEQVAELPLMLGSYVQVRVQGPMVKDVFSLPRCAVHNGNEVWIMNKEHRLDIRTVDILWRDRQRVLVREGLAAGELLVITDLAAPVPGMKLMSDDVDSGGSECKKPAEEVSQ